MTSSPLFIRVALSMVILGPIFQVGWLRASSMVAAWMRARGQSRKGPPLAVMRTSRMEAGIAAVQQLVQGGVLAVHGQQLAATGQGRLVHEGARPPPGTPCWPRRPGGRRAGPPRCWPGPRCPRWRPPRYRRRGAGRRPAGPRRPSAARGGRRGWSEARRRPPGSPRTRSGAGRSRTAPSAAPGSVPPPRPPRTTARDGPARRPAWKCRCSRWSRGGRGASRQLNPCTKCT